MSMTDVLRRADRNPTPVQPQSPDEYGQSKLVSDFEAEVRDALRNMQTGQSDVIRIANQLNQLRFNAMMKFAEEISKILGDKVSSTDLALALSMWAETKLTKTDETATPST